MEIEIHLGSSALGDAIKALVEDRLLSTDLGLAGSESVPWPNLLASDRAEVVIDHVSVRPAELRVRRGEPGTTNVSLPAQLGGPPRTVAVNCQRLGVDAIVDLYWVRIRDLQAAGVAAVPEESMMNVQARIELSLAQPVLVGTTLTVGLTIDQISLGFADVFLDPATLSGECGALVARLNEAALLARLAPPPLILDTSELTSALASALASARASGLTPWNAGAHLQGGALILRIQFENPAPIDLTGLIGSAWLIAWTAFHTSASSRLSGRDWALVLPAELFISKIDSAIERALGERTDFVINDDNRPSSTWSVTPAPAMGARCNPDGQASIITRFSIAALGACEPIGMDMDVNMTLPATLTMVTPGTLRIRLELQYEPDPGDLALCSILNSSLMATAGFAIGGAIAGWLGGVIAAAIAGLAGGIVTVTLGYESDAPSIARGDLIAVDGEEDTYYQDLAIPPLQNDTLGRLSADALVPCLDGLSVVGAMATPDESPAMLWQVETLEFRWVADGSCPPSEPVARARIYGRLSTGSASIPLVLWGPPTILGAPDGYREAVSVVARTNPSQYSVDLEFTAASVRALRSDSAATLEPVRVLIQSNAGARVITLRPMDETLSDAAMAEFHNLQVSICAGRRARLEAFDRRAGWLIEHLRERLGPLPSIPSGWPPGAFVWTLRIAGLDPRAAVQLGQIHNGNFVAAHQLSPDLGGGVFARVWQRRDCGEPQLAMYIDSKLGNSACGEGSLGFSLSHYVAAATVSVPEDVVGHRVFRTTAGLHVGVATTAGLWIYQLIASGKPRLLQRLRRRGVSSFTLVSTGLVVWGPGGAALLRRNGPLVELTDACVSAVVAAGGELRLITPAGSVNFNVEGQPIDRSCGPLELRRRISAHELGEVAGAQLGESAVIHTPGEHELIVLARHQTVSS